MCYVCHRPGDGWIQGGVMCWGPSRRRCCCWWWRWCWRPLGRSTGLEMTQCERRHPPDPRITHLICREQRKEGQRHMAAPPANVHGRLAPREARHHISRVIFKYGFEKEDYRVGDESGFFRTWALQRHHMLFAQPAALWKDRWSYFSA